DGMQMYFLVYSATDIRRLSPKLYALCLSTGDLGPVPRRPHRTNFDRRRRYRSKGQCARDAHYRIAEHCDKNFEGELETNLKTCCSLFRPQNSTRRQPTS